MLVETFFASELFGKRNHCPGRGSVAVTRPEGATSLAMESAGSPTPLARSRTRMPGAKMGGLENGFGGAIGERGDLGRAICARRRRSCRRSTPDEDARGTSGFLPNQARS